MSDKFKAWASQAVAQMRFPWDRAEVRKELLAHLEDREDDYVNQGLTKEEAQAQALAAMGDAVQTGKLLNKAHSPWLGWAWLVSKWLCVGLALYLSGLLLLEGFGNGGLERWFRKAGTLWDCGCEAHYSEFPAFQSRQPVETGLTLREGDYTLELTHGFYFIHPIEDGGAQYLSLGFLVRGSHIWNVRPDGLLENLRAVDDLGYEHVLQGSTRFQVDGEELGLSVWPVHVDIFIPYDGPLQQRQWFRFELPGTDLAFTVWTNGEVSQWAPQESGS